MPDLNETIKFRKIPQSDLDVLEQARVDLHNEIQDTHTAIIVSRLTTLVWKITHKKYEEFDDAAMQSALQNAEKWRRVKEIASFIDKDCPENCPIFGACENPICSDAHNTVEYVKIESKVKS